MQYGQFCPIAKATEIIGEKWTLLIIRELLMGGSRFNELQRGLSLISPTILSKRLESLSEQGLVLKKKISGQKGYEYFATESCQQLLPIIRALGDWGMCWTRSNLTEKDYDWWLVVIGDEVDLCVKDPGKDIDVYFTSMVKALVDIWMGDSSYKQAVKQGDLKLIGDKNLTQNISAWMSNSIFTDLPAASER